MYWLSRVSFCCGAVRFTLGRNLLYSGPAPARNLNFHDFMIIFNILIFLWVMIGTGSASTWCLMGMEFFSLLFAFCGCGINLVSCYTQVKSHIRCKLRSECFCKSFLRLESSTKFGSRVNHKISRVPRTAKRKKFNFMWNWIRNQV